MSRYLTLSLILGILLPGTALGIPAFVTHQGRMHQSNGDPMTGAAEVTFKLYQTATGGSAAFTQSTNVAFDDGFYSVAIGSNSNPLSSDFFNGDAYFLGITLDGQTEFVPRTQLATVPYAFRSGAVTGEVKALDGLTVNGVEVITPSGVLNVDTIQATGALILPQGDLSDAPDASDNAGQLYFAADEGIVYFSDGTEWKPLAGGSSGSEVAGAPSIISISPEQIQPGSDETISITGLDFVDGCEVEMDTLLMDSVTFIDSGHVTTDTGTVLEAGTYTVRVVNPVGLRATAIDALVVDGSPVWDTSEGALGHFIDSVDTNFQLEATDPEGQTLSFSQTGGTLPAGLSMDSSGLISGDPDDVSTQEDYEFTIEVADTAPVPNTVSRTFQMTIIHLPGQVAEAPAISCDWILAEGYSTGNGIYWLDPDEEGGNDPFTVYCNMETAGGGWTLVGHFIDWNSRTSFVGVITDECHDYETTCLSPNVVPNAYDLLVLDHANGDKWGWTDPSMGGPSAGLVGLFSGDASKWGTHGNTQWHWHTNPSGSSNAYTHHVNDGWMIDPSTWVNCTNNSQNNVGSECLACLREDGYCAGTPVDTAVFMRPNQ